MPRVALSALTPNDMRTAMGALGVSARTLATMIGKSSGTVGHYLTGRARIPKSCEDRLRKCLINYAKDFLTDTERDLLSAADMAACALTARNAAALAAGQLPGSAAGFPTGRLPRRQRHDPTQAETLPPYRVREDKTTLLVAAMRHWGKVCHGRYHHARSQAHQRDYQLELADIAAIMPRIPANVRGGDQHAFDITINTVEWDVISRALRAYAPTVHPEGKLDGPAYAFYQHWRKHRFAGYPFVPAVVKAERDELIGKLAGQ